MTTIATDSIAGQPQASFIDCGLWKGLMTVKQVLPPLCEETFAYPCHFCYEAPCVGGSPHCGRTSCVRRHYARRRDQRLRGVRLRWRAMGYALLQRCRHHDNWYDVQRFRVVRWWYTLKAIVCVFFDLWAPTFCRHGIECVDDVAIWDVHGPADYEYGGVAWTTLAVGRGFVTGWHYEIAYDQSV